MYQRQQEQIFNSSQLKGTKGYRYNPSKAGGGKSQSLEPPNNRTNIQRTDGQSSRFRPSQSPSDQQTLHNHARIAGARNSSDWHNLQKIQSKIPLKTRAIENGHRRVSSINIDELLQSHHKSLLESARRQQQTSQLELKRNSASTAGVIAADSSSQQVMQVLLTTATDASNNGLTPELMPSKKQTKTSQGRQNSKLSDMVQANMNLLTGVLISDGNSHHRPIWREDTSYNAIDFNKVNIKASIISEQKIKNAKEASRIIRHQNNKELKSSSRASTKQNTSQTKVEATLSTGRQNSIFFNNSYQSIDKMNLTFATQMPNPQHQLKQRDEQQQNQHHQQLSTQIQTSRTRTMLMQPTDSLLDKINTDVQANANRKKHDAVQEFANSVIHHNIASNFKIPTKYNKKAVQLDPIKLKKLSPVKESHQDDDQKIRHNISVAMMQQQQQRMANSFSPPRRGGRDERRQDLLQTSLKQVSNGYDLERGSLQAPLTALTYLAMSQKKNYNSVETMKKQDADNNSFERLPPATAGMNNTDISGNSNSSFNVKLGNKTIQQAFKLLQERQPQQQKRSYLQQQQEILINDDENLTADGSNKSSTGNQNQTSSQRSSFATANLNQLQQINTASSCNKTYQQFQLFTNNSDYSSSLERGVQNHQPIEQFKNTKKVLLQQKTLKQDSNSNEFVVLNTNVNSRLMRRDTDNQNYGTKTPQRTYERTDKLISYERGRDSSAIISAQQLAEVSYNESLFSLKRDSNIEDSDVHTPILEEKSYNDIDKWQSSTKRSDIKLLQSNEFNIPLINSKNFQHERQIESEETDRSRSLGLSRKVRSTLQGNMSQFTRQFKFLEDNQSEHKLRMQRRLANKSHQIKMKNIIEAQDKAIKQNIIADLEKFVSGYQCRRTKFEMEKALYHKFDVRKKERMGKDNSRPNDWLVGFDQFLDRLQMSARQVLQTVPSSYTSISIDPEEAVHEAHEQVISNKAGSIEEQENTIFLIKRIEQAKQNLGPQIQTIVKESSIPLQVLYNRKVDRLRVHECNKNLAPSAIKYEISDSYTGVNSKKLIQILSENAPKPYVFEVDFNDELENPSSYETSLEKFQRDTKTKVGSPVKLMDYMRGTSDFATAVDKFVEDMHRQVKMQQIDRSYEEKLASNNMKTDAEKDYKLSQQIVGMRRGKQFEFSQLENTEMPFNDQRQGETNIGQQIVQEQLKRQQTSQQSQMNFQFRRQQQQMFKKKQTQVSVTMLSSSTSELSSDEDDDAEAKKKYRAIGTAHGADRQHHRQFRGDYQESNSNSSSHSQKDVVRHLPVPKSFFSPSRKTAKPKRFRAISSDFNQKEDEFYLMSHTRMSQGGAEINHQCNLWNELEKDKYSVQQQSSQTFKEDEISSKEQQSLELTREQSQLSKNQNSSYKRQKLVRNMASLMIDDIKEREAIFGLTVGQEFDSMYAKIKAEREQQAKNIECVSVYDGRVPLHQRLVLLCQDFLESTADFELNDLFNFQNSLLGLDKNIKAEKLEVLERLVKELFKKYQIEVIKPNIDYLVTKYQTAFDKYKKVDIGRQKPAHSKFQSPLIHFRNSKFDKKQQKKKPVAKQSQVPTTGTAIQTQKQTNQDDDELIEDEFFDIVGELSLGQEKQMSQRIEATQNNQIPTVLQKSNTFFTASSNYPQPAEQKKQKEKMSRQNTYFTLKKRQSTFVRMETTKFSKKSSKQLNYGGSQQESPQKSNSNQRSRSQAMNDDDDDQDQDQQFDEQGRQGVWFAKLDWTDDDKFQHFGANQTINRKVIAADYLNPNESLQASANKGQVSKLAQVSNKQGKPLTNKLPNTILAKMAENSRKDLEEGFDQTAIRKKIVKEKSMFKANFQLKDIHTSPKELQKKITGVQN